MERYKSKFTESENSKADNIIVVDPGSVGAEGIETEKLLKALLDKKNIFVFSVDRDSYWGYVIADDSAEAKHYVEELYQQSYTPDIEVSPMTVKDLKEFVDMLINLKVKYG